MQSRTLLTLSALVLAAASSAQAAIVIDDFTTVVPDVNITLPKASSSIGPVTVGKAEVIVTQSTAGGVFNAIQVAAGTDGTTGALDYTSGNRDGAVSLTYAGSDLTGIDVLAGLFLEFAYYNQPGLPANPLTISVTATFTNGGVQNSVPFNYAGAGGTVVVPTLTLTGSGLTNLVVTIDAPRGGSFTITEVAGESDTSNIPEPASAALLATPALALVRRRR